MSTKIAYNQIVGRATVTPEDFGAIGDDISAGTVNKTAFEDMLAHVASEGGTIQLGPVVYTILGEINLSFPGGQQQILKIVGAGSKGDTATSSVLSFSSYLSGQTKGLYWGSNMVNAHLEGFTVQGAGSAILNDAAGTVNGLDDSTSSFSNGLTMIDVAFRDWSGYGANIVYWFQQYWKACYARNCGLGGIVIDGDQSPVFDMTGGAFFREMPIGLWIKKGNAIVRGWNGEDLDVGLKIGEGSAKRVRLDLSGANFEQMNENSTAIDVDDFSQIISMIGVSSQGPETPANATATYGIRFRRLNGYNIIQDYRPTWFVSSNGDGIDIPIQIDLAEPGAVLEMPDSRDDLITMGFGTTTRVQGAGRLSSKYVRANKFGDDPIDAVNGVESSLANREVEVFWTQSIDGSTIDLRTDPSVIVPNYIVNCDGGPVTMQLPDGGSSSIDSIRFKVLKIDAANNLTLDTFGTQKINGVDNPVMATQYETKDLFLPSLGTNWFDLNK